MAYADPEHRKAYNKSYYQKNREKLLADLRAKYDPEKERQAQLKYYQDPIRREKKKQEAREYYACNKEAVRNAAYLRLYGISVEEYEDLRIKQGGVCAICRREPAGRFHIDHDHVTKEVRGLLCQGCNLMLGHSGDLPERLRQAADYLERPRG